MHRAHDVAQKHLGKSTIHTKEHYDAKCTLTKYKHGDLVWYATDIKQLHQLLPSDGSLLKALT